MKGRKPATTFSLESMIMPRIVVIKRSAAEKPDRREEHCDFHNADYEYDRTDYVCESRKRGINGQRKAHDTRGNHQNTC